jgi:hypothetical protein
VTAAGTAPHEDTDWHRAIALASRHGEELGVDDVVGAVKARDFVWWSAARLPRFDRGRASKYRDDYCEGSHSNRS